MKLDELKEGLNSAWNTVTEGVTEGWQRLRKSVGAITHFKSAEDSNLPASRDVDDEAYWPRTTWAMLAGNVFEDDEKIVVRLEIPGMQKDNFTASALEKNSNGAIETAVSTTPGAIGYVGLGYAEKSVKALSITKNGAAIAPSVATVVLWGLVSFSAGTPLQARVISQAGDAPSLASTLNIGAFNLGNAIGAWLGGAVITAGGSLQSIPLVAACVTLCALALAVYVAWLDQRGAVAPAGLAACEAR